MIPTTAPSFYNWQMDTEAIQATHEWLIEGLVFDVQQADLWLSSWEISSDQIRRWFYSLEEQGITKEALLKRIYGEEYYKMN